MRTELQRFNYETQLQKWSQRITDCRSSGLHVKRWCQENGVSLSTYYKWQRRVFAVSAQPCETQFAELPISCTKPQHPASDIAASLQFNGTNIDFHNGADPTTIMAIIRAVKSC